MLATNPKKRPTAEKILKVMEKEFGEIKKGIEWKVEGKKLIVSGLGPIPDCSEKAPWEEEKDSIQSSLSREGQRRSEILRSATSPNSQQSNCTLT